MNFIREIKACDENVAKHYYDLIKNLPEEYWSNSSVGDQSENNKSGFAHWRTSQSLRTELVEPALCGNLNELLTTLIKRYRNELISESPSLGFDELTTLNPEMSENATILRYKEGDYYDWHVDEMFYFVEATGPQFSMLSRGISGVLYLNDDFEGGETDFGNGRIIKPKAGHAAVFPSNRFYPHRSCTIESGTKYAVVTWWFQRQLLTGDTIQSIQQIFSND